MDFKDKATSFMKVKAVFGEKAFILEDSSQFQ